MALFDQCIGLYEFSSGKYIQPISDGHDCVEYNPLLANVDVVSLDVCVKYL